MNDRRSRIRFVWGWFVAVAAFVFCYGPAIAITSVLQSGGQSQIPQYPTTYLPPELPGAIIDGNAPRALRILKKNPALVYAVTGGSSRETPLHIAVAYSDNMTIIRWLVENGSDLSARCYNQFTPLHLAQSPAVAKLLLKAGADPNLRSSWGDTPLQMAAEDNRPEVARAIVSYGIPMDLRTALLLKERDIAKRIIEKYPESVKKPSGSGLWGDKTPLGIAARQGDTEMVLLLLKNGAPVKSGTMNPNMGGDANALTNAVWAGKADIVEILCKAGADTNVVGGKFYHRLLDYAVKHSSKRIQEILIEYGAKHSRFFTETQPKK